MFRAAERAWRVHRPACTACSAAAGARRWAALCAQGAGLREDMRAAGQRLANEREADRAPAPGQGVLFGAAPVQEIIL